MARIRFFQLAVAAMVALAATPAHGQLKVKKDAAQDLPDETKQKVVDAISRSLLNGYVHEDVAKKMAADIKDKLKSGQYAKITSASDFAQKLTKDLQAISKDKHLRILTGPAKPEKGAKRPRPINYGFVKVEILEG